MRKSMASQSPTSVVASDGALAKRPSELARYGGHRDAYACGPLTRSAVAGLRTHPRTMYTPIHRSMNENEPLQTHVDDGTRKGRRAKIEDQLVLFIERGAGVVILRSEVAPLGSAAQVGRVLAKMVSDGRLVRVSKGVYAKTRVNKFTGRPAPAAPFESIAAEAFRKLGIDVQPGRLAREYNEGSTTQVPMTPLVSTGKRRIRRKIQVGSKTVKYEK